VAGVESAMADLATYLGAPDILARCAYAGAWCSSC
jgi:hypothetical protein